MKPRRPSRCPRPAALERGYHADDPDIRRHVAACESCAREWREIQLIDELGALWRTERSAAAGDVVNRSAPPARTRWIRRTALGVGAMSAVAAAVALAAHLTGARSRSRDDQAAPTVPAEDLVRLTDGNATVDVECAPVRNDVVEVQGTSFDAVLSAGRLRSVTVHRGLVEVVPAGGAAVLINAGDTWTAAPAPDANGVRTLR